MPGAHVNLQLGPSTYEVSVAVVGGQLVQPDGTTGKIKPATAASTTVLGVARQDGQPAGSNPGVGGNAGPLNIGWAQPEIGVVYGPTDVDVVYAANAAFGQLLLAAANGQVTPAGAGPAADQVVGRCTEPGGVLSGAVGRMRLRV